MSFSPPPLQLPDTVLSAELLHGTLQRLGPGMRPINWPDTPHTRAAALQHTLREELRAGYVACEMTAAWVWQTARTPPVPLTLCSKSKTALARQEQYFLHWFKLTPTDTVQLGPARVTSPARTVGDILRSNIPLTKEVRVTLRLLTLRHARERSVAALQAALQELLRKEWLRTNRNTRKHFCNRAEAVWGWKAGR